MIVTTRIREHFDCIATCCDKELSGNYAEFSAREDCYVETDPVLLPADEYNRNLLNNVHPADWVNPEPASR
ncbi:MAG: hypothetical protein PHD01_09195, partial [Geobacteraceae bacterium]|nr:hypothetical protein [Geobacteraceae bacterium]